MYGAFPEWGDGISWQAVPHPPEHFQPRVSWSWGYMFVWLNHQINILVPDSLGIGELGRTDQFLSRLETGLVLCFPEGLSGQCFSSLELYQWINQAQANNVSCLSELLLRQLLTSMKPLTAHGNQAILGRKEINISWKKVRVKIKHQDHVSHRNFICSLALSCINEIEQLFSGSLEMFWACWDLLIFIIIGFEFCEFCSASFQNNCLITA